ncbi:MAG: hypothetical protein E7589_05240 [Ruminococcaceae bacterium]|nr:hypothetical protein [Oscillospiraceae bacterium]
MKNNQNRAEKYFIQKNFLIIEIVLIILAITAAYVMFFVRFGGPIGLPVLLVCSIVFAIFRSRIVKDEEFEEIKNRILADNQIEISDSTITSYDLKEANLKRMKNGSVVSPNYYLTEITVLPSEVKVKSYYVNIIDASVKIISHSVTDSKSIDITEEIIRTKYGNKKSVYIRMDGSDVVIPIPYNDYRTAQLVEQIKSL